jgi:NADH-quinone oxidoreductase subunit K
MLTLLRTGGSEAWHYLVLGAILFSLGIFAILVRRNVIGLLMGIELVLNAASLNFTTFSRFGPGNLDGQVVSVFIIILAAAEAVVALALFFAMFQLRKTTNVDDADDLRR